MAELSEADPSWPEKEIRPATKKRPEEVDRRRAGAFYQRRERTEPISIPPAVGRRRSFDEAESESETEEMVPPHVLVSRRWSSPSVGFPLSTGPGRPLKGRDLRLVRNAVLRLTGFLED